MKLKTYHQEQTEGVVEVLTARATQARRNLEPTGGQDDSEREPETTIRRQSSSTKGVTNSHFPAKALAHATREPDRKKYIPHTSQQLDKTTITESQSDNNVGLSDISGTHVDCAQHESGEGESAQAQRSRVTELAALNGLVQTGLELTTEGTELSLSGVDVSQGSITETGSGASDVMLVGELRLNGGAASLGGVLRRNLADVLLEGTVVGLGGRHDELNHLDI